MRNLDTLSPDQRAALEGTINFIDTPTRQSFFLEGAAGCGKTELLGYAFDHARRRGLRVLWLAPTGAAVNVLKQRFGEPLQTQHSALTRATDHVTFIRLFDRPWQYINRFADSSHFDIPAA